MVSGSGHWGQTPVVGLHTLAASEPEQLSGVSMEQLALDAMATREASDDGDGL
jgi:hypothetical protein